MNRGYMFNYPLHALPTSAHEGALPARHNFIRVSFKFGDSTYSDQASGLILSALKTAEDGEGIIVRVHEIFGRDGQVRLEFDRDLGLSQKVDLLERPLGAVEVGRRDVRFPIRPHRIESLRVRFLH